MNRVGFEGAARAVAAFLGVACGSFGASAQPLAVRIETNESVFTPLHSYAAGEIGHDVIFFSGISGMGLHGLSQNGTQIGFPTTVFNREVFLYDLETDTLYSGGIGHLPDGVRKALTVTNPTPVQYGSFLYIYGGYGPTNDNTDWTTNASVTIVDLSQVQTALRNAQLVPEGAFTVIPTFEGEVAGAKCIKMDNMCALIGGAYFTGDYGRMATAQFLETYQIKVRMFDSASSFSVSTHIFPQTAQVATQDRLRRRDMNAFPATLPASGGGMAAGYVVLGGVFRSGFFTWDTPLSYAMGDADITHHTGFTQHMNHYEAPGASFYSEALDQNRFLLLSGISSHTWDGEQFNPIAGALFQVPWTAEITEITMEEGVFTSETVNGVMPLPHSNAELILNEKLVRNANGQVMTDALPAAEVRLGSIFGGLRAASAAVSPATFASNAILDAYIVYGVRGDVSRDGVVNSTDLATMLGAWSTPNTVCDLNCDGVVNSTDLALLLGNWGNNTPG